AVVGIRYFQPQRAKCAWQGSDGINDGGQAVTLRQRFDGVMQTDQLAREDEFTVGQRLFVERDDNIAAIGEDGGLLCTNDGLSLLRLAQRFLRAILLKAGAAI